MFSSIKLLITFNVQNISIPRITKSRLINVRSYCRWVHRRPVRVIKPEDYEMSLVRKHKRPVKNRVEAVKTPFEDHTHTADEQNVIDNETNTIAPAANLSDDVRHRISAYEKHIESPYNKKGRSNKMQTGQQKLTTHRTSNSGSEMPVFTKLKEDDNLLGRLMTSVKSKKQREKKGLILLEGKRLIADSVAAGVIPQYVFFSNTSNITGLKLPTNGTQLYKISYKTISLWSDVATSQGVIAICKLPTPEEIVPEDEALPLTIVCDNVRDPGNLGAILRTAVGVGCRQVVLTKGCMDPWEPKVLRSGVGAHFRMKLFRDVSWEDLLDIIEDGFVCLADNNVKAGDCDSSLGRCDSSDCDTLSQPAEARGNAEAQVESNNGDSVPVVPYYSVDYASQKSVVLVIGGETHGLSSFSYHLAVSRSGVKVNIPLSNGMESLNTGTALGIIAFEMKRQFLANPIMNDVDTHVPQSQPGLESKY